MSAKIRIARILPCLLWLTAASAGQTATGQALDDAVRELARRVSARMTAGDTAHVSAHNLSSLSAADLSRARIQFERALRRTGARHTVEVTLTASQNLHGFLLVADAPEKFVEMVRFRPEPARSTRMILQKQLLWEQETPVLDVAVQDDKMWVLEPENMIQYARHGAAWERVEAKPVTTAQAVRDPRGRLQVSGDSVTAVVPFTSVPTVEINGLLLAAEPDGRVHIYDPAKRQLGVIDAWRGDIAAPETGCGAGRQVLVSGSEDSDLEDSLTSFTIVDGKPLQLSEALEFPGPITALWPAGAGALAIAHNFKTGNYAAYSVSLDCGR